MKSGDLHYSISQTEERWRWMVHFEDGLKTGFSPNRTAAILAAIKAVNKAARQQRRAARATARQPTNA
jgi:hypothetical protein